MISTEMFYGQGLGNQLACYVATRVMAVERGVDFGIHDPHNYMGDPRFNSKGVYFMDIDMGKEVKRENIEVFYNEEDYRYFNDTNRHDQIYGCWVNLTDPKIKELPDNTHIHGILQGPDYFYDHIDEVREWLKVKPEYDVMDYSADDICVLNVRANLDPAVYLPRSYWVHAINHMLDINPNFRFVVITEDVQTVEKLLPELKGSIFRLGVGEAYAVVKNARYLIVSNSSFSIFPSLTSTVVKHIIAPKYMLRYNLSDGYWCQGYNIYPTYTYMDREGNLSSYEECVKEFKDYCDSTGFYEKKVIRSHKPFPSPATLKP